MKLIAFLLGFVAAVSAIKQVTFQLPQEKLITVRKVGAACAAEFNVDPGLLSKVGDATLSRDEASNKFLYCFALKIGLIKDDGHIFVDKVIGLLGNHPLAAEMKDALNKCDEVTKENPIATLVELNSCYAVTSPVLFAF